MMTIPPIKGVLSISGLVSISVLLLTLLLLLIGVLHLPLEPFEWRLPTALVPEAEVIVLPALFEVVVAVLLVCACAVERVFVTLAVGVGCLSVGFAMLLLLATIVTIVTIVFIWISSLILLPLLTAILFLRSTLGFLMGPETIEFIVCFLLRVSTSSPALCSLSKVLRCAIVEGTTSWATSSL